MAASRPLISPIEAVFLLILGAVAGLALGTVFMETADTIFSRGAELHYAEAVHRLIVSKSVSYPVDHAAPHDGWLPSCSCGGTGNQCTTVPKPGAGQVQDCSLLSAWSQQFEAPVQGLVGSPGKDLMTPSGAVLIVTPSKGIGPRQGVPAVGFTKLRDLAPKAQAQRPFT
ncbi:hypothetical protein QJQ45_015148 [Haematococcus lacustris]|nr:hypothetical protein QJQ45_015148 [Haematococcus lacustris]